MWARPPARSRPAAFNGGLLDRGGRSMSACRTRSTVVIAPTSRRRRGSSSWTNLRSLDHRSRPPGTKAHQSFSSFSSHPGGGPKLGGDLRELGSQVLNTTASTVSESAIRRWRARSTKLEVIAAVTIVTNAISSRSPPVSAGGGAGCLRDEDPPELEQVPAEVPHLRPPGMEAPTCLTSPPPRTRTMSPPKGDLPAACRICQPWRYSARIDGHTHPPANLVIDAGQGHLDWWWRGMDPNQRRYCRLFLQNGHQTLYDIVTPAGSSMCRVLAGVGGGHDQLRAGAAHPEHGSGWR